MASFILATCTVCEKGFRHHHSKAGKFCSHACYRVAQRRGAYRGSIEQSSRLRSCHHCGDVVARSPSRKRTGEYSDKIFCSRACYDASRSDVRKARDIACERCGSSFTPVGGKSPRFCSDVCWKAAKKAKPVNCINCGCLFTGLKWFPSRQRFSGTNGNKTCSDACHLEWISRNPDRKKRISKAFRGSNHPNWQGGKARINHRSNRGSNWKEQREKALRRDGFQCVECGLSNDDCRVRYGRSLDVDHVEPFHNFTDHKSANKLSNLRSVCVSCHMVAEHKRTGVQMILPLAEPRRESAAFKKAGLSEAA